MEQLPLSFTELLEVVAYFSSLAILIGIALQAFLLFFAEKKLSVRMLMVIVSTQILAFIGTIILWLKWPSGLIILYGPILFPAIINQLIFVPLVPGFFGYKSKGKKLKAKETESH